MRGLRYILVVLFLICYRGLSAQEFDLYDFRYYKRFESVEELLAPEVKDSLTEPKFVLNRRFSTRALDYNFAMVRYARQGVEFYRREISLNGAEMPYLSPNAIRALQLTAEYTVDHISLHVDTLPKQKTTAGIFFSMRNMPYALRLSTAQRMSKGWSLAANVEARTGRDLHIEGLFGNSLEVDVIASKRFNDNHHLSFALFAKPSMRSSRLASTDEAFRLTGNNLYNPAWGYQNGQIRNSRIRRELLPTAFVGYEWRLNDRTRLNWTATATIGLRRYSMLDWFDAQTPSPDNYRYMPSYFADEEDVSLMVESAWLNRNPKYTQLDFDTLIATNRLNGGAAVYAISDRVERVARSLFRCAAITKTEKGEISYGLEVKMRNSRNYKQMRDLLGAHYIIDLDYFLLDDDTFGNALQNNLSTPNRRIEEGYRFGYDYALRRYDASLFGTYRYHTTNFDLEIAAAFGYCDISRRGFYRKELFADSSLGVSRHLRFAPYSLRVSAEYLINDNHFVRGGIYVKSTPCESENLFLQSQYNNRTIVNPTALSRFGANMQYMFQRQNLAVSTTLFIRSMLNDTQVRHLYDDLRGEYADVVTSNIDHLCYGMEVEVQYRFATNFRATAAAAVGRYKYSDNALVTIYSDTTNALIADHVESNTEGLSLGNMPQVAATIGLSYYNKGWWASINANYAGLRYIEPSTTMRTARVLAMTTSPEQYSAIIEQERLSDAFTIDLSISKSIFINRLSRKMYSTVAAPRFEDKHPQSRLVFRVGVRNLLGSANIVYSGYESSRLQRYKLAGEYIYNRQASHYLYAYPRTYYASASFVF